jgi:YD repeat-containing protein
LTGLDAGTYILSYYKWGTKWDYIETTVIVAGSSHTITLPAGQYDEIRFYPKGAQLTTYTYDPLIGVTSVTDANGNTTYYNYDSFSRLQLIRDNNNDILKGYEYRYKIMN